MCHIGAIGAWLIDRRCQGAGNPGAGEWGDGKWAGGGANKVDAGAKSPEKLWQASMSAGDCIRGLNLGTQDSFFLGPRGPLVPPLIPVAGWTRVR